MLEKIKLEIVKLKNNDDVRLIEINKNDSKLHSIIFKICYGQIRGCDTLLQEVNEMIITKGYKLIPIILLVNMVMLMI